MLGKPAAGKARKLTIAIVAVVVAAGAGAWWYSGKSSTPKAAAPVQRPVPVVVATATRQAVPIEVTVIGSVQASETVLVKSRIDGEITAMHFKEGDEVKSGEMLFTLDSRALETQLRQAEANLARDQAQLLSAKRDLDRKVDLVKRDFATRATLDQSQASVDTLLAAVKSDEAAIENLRVQISYTRIRAPISGRTGAVTQTTGNVVKANDVQALVTINRLQPVKIAFAVPQKYFDAVRTAMAAGPIEVRASRTASAKSPAESDSERGQINFVDNSVDLATGTFQMKALFENKSNALWPGMFVDVIARLGVQDAALTIPNVAISIGQQGPFIFVVKPDNSVEMRTVEVLREFGNLSVISKGLTADERVVVDGQLRLTNGSRVEAREPAKTNTGTTEAGKPAAAAPGDGNSKKPM